MAHEIQDSGDRNFGYPPVPNVYTESVSTFGGLRGAGLAEYTAPELSRYPYYSPYASASFTPPPGAFSYTDNIDEYAPIQNASVIPPALSPDYRHLAPLTFNGNDLLPRDAMSTPTTTRTRRPRGTTGSIVCDGCGYKFTVKTSLNRHRKVCRGKRSARKQSRKQPKSMETKGAGVHANNNTDAMSVSETQPNQQDNEDQDAGYNGDLELISTWNTMIESQGPSKATSAPNSIIPRSNYQWPLGTQPYIPQGPDTSEDHKSFGCDLCTLIVARRDILQIHKAKVHGMREAPFMPESGRVNTPSYLEGVTPENSTKHSRRSLLIFDGGALSSSPCQPCMLQGSDCIVNPSVSSLCVRCSFYDRGFYCGAAGVKYRKPQGAVDDPRVTAANSEHYTQPMEQRSNPAAPEAPHPGNPSRSTGTQHSSSALMGHSQSTSPEPSHYPFSNYFNEGLEGWGDDGTNGK